MKRVKLMILGVAVLALALIAGCGTQPQQAAAPAPASVPAPAPAPAATTPAPAATPTSAAPTKNPTDYVGEATCKGCHKMDNFDKTKHTTSFKKLSDYQFSKPLAEVTIYDGANKDAKSAKVDLNKALGVHMGSTIVVEVPKDAGFAKQYYRVAKLTKGADGKYTWEPVAKVEGKEDISAEDYSSCMTCHAPGLGKPGKPDPSVTCEACHGPGADHVKLEMSASNADQKAFGARFINVPNADTCQTCHKGDPTKDATTGAITVSNHYGDRDYSFSKHAASSFINGCLSCHRAHGVNAKGTLLRTDDPKQLCALCHGNNYDPEKIMFKNTSDKNGHTTVDHSFGAIPLSALAVNEKTKAMEVKDQKALDLIKSKLPELFK